MYNIRKRFINTVEMITILLEVTADSHFIVTSENPIRIEKGTPPSLTLKSRKDMFLKKAIIIDLKTEN